MCTTFSCMSVFLSDPWWRSIDFIWFSYCILFYCPYSLVLCFTLCCACLSSKSCRREMFHMVKDKLGSALPLQRQVDPNIASGMPPTT